MYNTLVLYYLMGFLALLGATPSIDNSEIRDYGRHRVWFASGVLPPVNKNLSKEEIEKLLKIYTDLCKQFPDIIDVSPYKVEIYQHEDGTYIYVSVYA